MPGPQALRPAQDWLLRLAWHELAWLVPLALLSELEAHVQQGWFEDGPITKRSWPRSWLGARHQTASGQQASPGPHRCSVHGDRPPVRKGSARLQCCFPQCAVPKAVGATFAWTPGDIYIIVWKAYRPRRVISNAPR